MAGEADGEIEAIEEAAAQWVVRLGDGPRDADRDAFEAWLAEDPRHADAFARVHRVWVGAGAAGRALRRRKRARAAAGVLAVLALAAPIALLLRDPVHGTRRGERETVVLADGSRLTLNTDSRLSVRYRDKERRVTLARGEVYFDVARDAQRPFVVEVDEDRVRVLGTSFLVRRDRGTAQVALVSGSVVVAHGGEAALRRPPMVLSPGERIRWGGEAEPHVDRPKLEDYLAWRRGELVLDKMPVAEAVAEMNRYTDNPIVLADPAAASARISGVFKTGDSDAFARTLARLYGLTATRRGDRTVLERPSAG